jgi:signal transduction histidine kinase
LDLARADNFTVGNESCDAVPLLEALADRFRNKGVLVDLECGGNPVRLRMGCEAFESVVTNLLENARQHGGNGVRISLLGRMETAAASRVFVLDIRDNGPGISAGNRDKVFRPFFTTAREAGGSGLGLAIVQALLLAHDGTITLEPEESGTCFRLTMPLS